MRVFVFASVLLASMPAHADPARAWAAARANVPASTTAIFGIDLDKAMSSSLSAFAGPLMATLGVRATLESIRTTCKIDPQKVVDGMVVVEGATSDVGAYFLSLDGLDEAGLVACGNQLAKKKTAEAPAPTVRDGAIREIALGDKTIYATWIGADVIAIAAKPADKAMLTTFTSGSGALAKTALGKLATKTNTSAAIWFATTKSRPAVQGKKMKQGNGALEIANKTLAASVAMTFASKTEAKAVAKLVNDQIIALLASGQLDAVVMEMLNKVVITATGAELTVVGSIPDAELLPMIGAMTGR